MNVSEVSTELWESAPCIKSAQTELGEVTVYIFEGKTIQVQRDSAIVEEVEYGIDMFFEQFPSGEWVTKRISGSVYRKGTNSNFPDVGSTMARHRKIKRVISTFVNTWVKTDEGTKTLQASKLGHQASVIASLENREDELLAELEQVRQQKIEASRQFQEMKQAYGCD